MSRKRQYSLMLILLLSLTATVAADQPSAVNALTEAAKPGEPATDLEPILGTRDLLLLEENFDGTTLPKEWTVKSGDLQVAGGNLHASQKKTGDRLCLFSCAQPLQDAIVQIDFRFDGGRGINVSCNPSRGELQKHGHLFVGRFSEPTGVGRLSESTM